MTWRRKSRLERRTIADEANKRRNGPVAVVQEATTPLELTIDQKRYAPTGLRTEVLQRDKYRCRYCGDPVTMNTAKMDHVKPYILGGKTDFKNLVACCAFCNKAKGNQVIGYAPNIGRPTNPFNKPRKGNCHY